MTLLLATINVSVDVNSLATVLTPVAVVLLGIWQHRNAGKVAEKVEAVRTAADGLESSRTADKVDLDDKLEVIRKDVNSNLTKALTELKELREHFGVVEGEPLPPADRSG
jgi:hypothetical protein